MLRQVVGDAGASPVWLSVDQSITALYGLEGRRVILLMSDGQDAPAANQRQASFKDVVDRLRRANVMVCIGFSASNAATAGRSSSARARTCARWPTSAAAATSR